LPDLPRDSTRLARLAIWTLRRLTIVDGGRQKMAIVKIRMG